MRYNSLQDFTKKGIPALAKGACAIVVAEDLVEVPATVAHCFRLGFQDVVLLAPVELEMPEALAQKVHRVDADTALADTAQVAVNAIMDKVEGKWLFYCYNAEFLFFPFCEDRTIGEMLAFHTEERRDAVLTYVVDLYAGDLDTSPQAVSLEEAFLDKSGYYALARNDENGHPRERQLNFFGGLRWRFEEHIPEVRRKIDRISVFKAKKGLRLRDDHTFSDEEYNTYACPWHNNITVALASFRTAKALKANAGSTFEISTFKWHNSVPFEWRSKQFLDMGLMEPGQWF